MPLPIWSLPFWPWVALLLGLACAARLLIHAVNGPGWGLADGALLAALGVAGLAAWRFRPAPAQVALPLSAIPSAPRAAAPPSPARERRSHPRVMLDLAVQVEWHQTGRQAARLHDISRGGARIRDAAPEPAGRRGLLHVPGLNLPVPFTVVVWRQETGMHIRFDLEGMGLEALGTQLEQLIARS
jgi:hypothetical protein